MSQPESTDPRDHEGTTVARFGGEWKTLCRCGWSGAWWPLQSQAEIEHEHHVDVACVEATEEMR